MREPLTIELADEAQAAALRGHLQPFDVEAVAVDGHWELRIHLVESNPESRIANALHGIDTWLMTAGVDSIRVSLDGRSYTLHPPPPGRLAGVAKAIR